MTNIQAASAQWASRPDDQRFVTLEDLQAAVDRRKQIARSKVVPFRQLSVVADEQTNALAIAGHNGAVSSMTHWSFGQLASQVGADASFLRKLPASVAEIPFEYMLKFGDRSDAQTQLYYTQDGQLSEIRAATGPKYGRIFDARVVRLVHEMNERQGGRWTVPTPFRTAANVGTASDFVVDKKSTTLYASDRDVFIFLVDENRAIELDGQQYLRGFFVSNSEVGNASLYLSTFLYSMVCSNRIIWGAAEVEQIRIRHTSSAPERFIAEVGPALQAIAESSPQPIVKAITEAKLTRIATKAQQVADWLKAKKTKKGVRVFSDTEIVTALKLAEAGGSTGSSGDPTNLWDVIQGGTAHAREIGRTDDRLELERRWSSLLAQSAAGQTLVVANGE